MKWHSSILQVQKANKPKALSKAFYFVLGLDMSYYKEGCKFRWSKEDRVLKHKCKIKRETKSPHEHLDIVYGLLVVGSSIMSREFRLSEVLTFGAESPDAC